MSQPPPPGAGPYRGPGPHGQPFAPPAFAARRRQAPRLLGIVIAVAGVLLVVAVLLPWVKATVSLSPFDDLNRSVNGVSDDVIVGWLTLFCALAAIGLGAFGALEGSGRKAGAAAIPGAVALLSLLVVPLRLDSAKADLIPENRTNLPPALREAILRQIQVSLDYGWFIALLLAVVVVAVGAVAFAIASAQP